MDEHKSGRWPKGRQQETDQRGDGVACLQNDGMMNVTCLKGMIAYLIACLIVRSGWLAG
jgi:hypothetical protein